MIRMYRFRPDPSRSAEFLASLWQGPVPEDLSLRQWLYVDSDPREMVLLCDCDEPGQAWVERCFGSFGTLTADNVTDATPGLAACLDRRLEEFGDWLRARGSGEDEIARQLDVRQRGLQAGTPDEAVEAGRAWAREQPAQRSAS